ncbi:ABC transporter permease [Bacillota bacterium Meth-B3]
MILYILKRLATAILQIFVVATIVFLILQIMPGDPAVLMLEANGTQPDEAAVMALRENLGLNRPVTAQYAEWVARLFSLDFGESYYYKQPVSRLIAQRFVNTLELAVVAVVVASLLGILVGVACSRARGTLIDRLFSGITVLGVSIPSYVMGALLIILFSLNLGWLPSSGFTSFARSPIKHLQGAILPSLTLALGFAATVARITRSSMLEEINREYVQTLRAKGLGEGRVIYQHGLRNSLIPTVTVIGLQLGSLIGGMVVIENIFSWPGLSTLLITAVNHRDYRMLQGCVVVIAATYILINLLVDLIYRVIDPRVRR